jgi:Mg2+ and Co2+ transporter CorA
LTPQNRGTALEETVKQPGLVWCYHRTDEGYGGLQATVPPTDCAFRWIHLNLSDQRSLRWLEVEAGLPPAIHDLLITRDSHQRYAVEEGVLGLVLHDFERGFESETIGKIGGLHVALKPGLVITGRYRPLHSADIFRARLEGGQAPEDATAALTLLLDVLVDNLGSLVLDLSTDLLDAEEALLVDDQAPDTRDLIQARRRSAQLHRMIGGMRLLLQRMANAEDIPTHFASVTQRFRSRLAALDQDIVSGQNQLKLLRDELDLQAAQRTNANVYLLSILTALMMPATLVTGFFGMNTGGLPFARGEHGTILATAVALFSAIASWLLLRWMGLVRKQ